MLYTFQALRSDIELVFRKFPRNSRISPLTPGHLTAGALPVQSLFAPNRQFCTLTIDEAHNMRNYGPLFYGGAELRQRSYGAVLMTATPVTTTPLVSDSIP